MRLVFLSVSAEIGGSETSLLELVRSLAARSSAPVMTVVVPREGALAVRVRAAGADVRVLPMPEALLGFGEWGARGSTALARRGVALLQAAGPINAYRRSLRGLIEELRPDVVHSNGIKLHVLASRALPDHVALVWHIHEYVGSRPLTRALLRRSQRRVSAIVANSHSVAEDVRSALAPPVPVSVIHNAIDLARFSPAGAAMDLDRACGLPAVDAAVRIGLVGTFARWKGQPTFLRALAQLPPTGVRGYVIGGAVYDTAGSQFSEAELRAQADEAGLAGRIGFSGFVEDPAPAMRALDVVVHASSAPEPFGLVIAEGMACGRAVVVSAAGGAAELVEDGVTALTFAPEDVGGLARALARLAGDETLRRRLGAAARQQALAAFEPAAFGAAFVRVYDAAAARVGVPA